MLKYILKRIGIGLITLFVLASITFFLNKIMPGSPFSQDNKVMDPKTMEALKAKYGLDKPIMEQYVVYFKNAMVGDFGESISKKGQTVAGIIAKRAPITAKLGIIAFVISLIIGITLGIVSALTKRKWINNIITFIATIGVSLPSFLLALILMIVFGVILQALPTVGLKTFNSYILPASTLALYPISMITRLTRSSLRDVMNKDYITLAESKGSGQLKTTIKHGLKNALLPVVTYCGPMFAGLVTGSFVVEKVFTIPGIGNEFVSSVTNRDYTLIMGLTIFLGAIVILMNLITDIVAGFIDPRIKLEK